MLTNSAIMSNARSQLKGKWRAVIVVSLIYVLVALIPGSLKKIGGIINLIIGGPIAFGISYYFLAFIRGKNPSLEDLFKGFSVFFKTFIAYVLIMVFTLLWALLLIVPGIIAALSYSMTFFLLVDNNDMNAQDAIKKSKAIMEGNKYRYFCFLCRFTGWFLLCIVTIGIGLLWFIPYFMTSNAKFYETLIHPETNQMNAPATPVNA